MQLREKIHAAINRMPPGILSLLYEQIEALENKRGAKQPKTRSYPLAEIHKLTKESKSSWSETVQEERKERL